MPIIDAATGEIAQAQIFVATLGASNYTYACATARQTTADWIGAHVRRARVHRRRAAPDRARPDPRALIARARPLRARAATAARRIRRPLRTVRPAGRGPLIRATSPKSRARCSWSSAGFWRGCATAASSASPSSTPRSPSCSIDLNERPFKKLPGCRRAPSRSSTRRRCGRCRPRASSSARWKSAKVNIDYHVEVDGHYYSVPHGSCGTQVELRVTTAPVECFAAQPARGLHARSHQRGGYTTVPEHMPASHRAHRSGRRPKLIAWGERIGVSTAARRDAGSSSTARIPSRATAPAWACSAWRASYGAHGWRPPAPGRCRSARPATAASPRSSRRGLDRQPLAGCHQPELPLPAHENVRGPDYYH